MKTLKQILNRIKTELKDLLILQSNIFKDNRGFFKEVEKKNKHF